MTIIRGIVITMRRFDICRDIKCNCLKEGVCSFDDCIYTTAEIIAMAEKEENKEFMLLILKLLAFTAGLILASMILINVFRG